MFANKRPEIASRVLPEWVRKALLLGSLSLRKECILGACTHSWLVFVDLMSWEIVVVLNPERRAGVTIKTTIYHHWSQPTQQATKSPGSAHRSFISASALRKESLATSNFYRIWRKLYISCRSGALSYSYSRRDECIGCFWKWVAAAKLLLYTGMHGHSTGEYLSRNWTHEWCGQNCPCSILTLSLYTSYCGKNGGSAMIIILPKSHSWSVADPGRETANLVLWPIFLTILLPQTVGFTSLKMQWFFQGQDLMLRTHAATHSSAVCQSPHTVSDQCYCLYITVIKCLTEATLRGELFTLSHGFWELCLCSLNCASQLPVKPKNMVAGV